jgi:hypothetical protein
MFRAKVGIMGGEVYALLEELTDFIQRGDPDQEYLLSKEDTILLLHYINYLRRIEDHVRQSLTDRLQLSRWGFYQEN